MIRNSYFIIWLLVFSNANAKVGNDSASLQKVQADDIIKEVFSDYQKIFTTTHDEKALERIFISDEEWKSLLTTATTKQPNCITADETEFDATINFKVYKELVDSKKINIKQLFIKRIDYANSCGNLFVIPRVTCIVQYNNDKVVEVPFLLIKISENQYKIIRNFLSYKIFPNE